MKFINLNVLLRIMLARLINKGTEFTCPICSYTGPFLDTKPKTGIRKHASCPQCGSLERQRLQFLVLQEMAKANDFSKMSILHFAPEPSLQKFFKDKFRSYTSSDLCMKNVDYQADMRDLPFENESFDFAFASHILEHIKEDAKALAEISRILKPNGIAILPVPIVAEATIEFPEPRADLDGHVRAPGRDYYERYLSYFKKVAQFAPEDFPKKYQLGNEPLATIPVCYK